MDDSREGKDMSDKGTNVVRMVPDYHTEKYLEVTVDISAKFMEKPVPPIRIKVAVGPFRNKMKAAYWLRGMHAKLLDEARLRTAGGIFLEFPFWNDAMNWVRPDHRVPALPMTEEPQEDVEGFITWVESVLLEQVEQFGYILSAKYGRPFKIDIP